MTTTSPDNWGWRARIGMFIVASECVPEAEWWAMMPAGVSVHAARVLQPAPWAAWAADGTAVEPSDDLKRGAAQFAAMKLSAIVLGHSSSSIASGKGWDDAVIAALSGVAGPDCAVTTNGRDCLAALTALGIKRPFLVFPAWFGDAMLPKGFAYAADHGFEPAGHMRFDPGPGWREFAPSELYPQGLGFDQDVEALYRQIRSACPDNADGVLIAGTGFRCVGIIDALEADLARPVVTANQASLWNCLQLSGVTPKVVGYGRLLSG